MEIGADPGSKLLCKGFMGLQTHFWGVGVWWGWLWLFLQGGTPLEAIESGGVAIGYHRTLLPSIATAK